MKKFYLLIASLIMAIIPIIAQDASDKSSEKLFIDVETMPEYPGGQQALFQFLSENVKYPKIAQDNNIQGRVVVSFVVEKDGSISNVDVIKSVDPSLDKEAVRVVKTMPRWKPGTMEGKPVRVRFSMPVNFKLNDKKKK